MNIRATAVPGKSGWANPTADRLVIRGDHAPTRLGAEHPEVEDRLRSEGGAAHGRPRGDVR